MEKTLESSWLIQRLNKPHNIIIEGEAVDNPFSFGGGYINGGLLDKAMELIRPIFSFDYMGAAEFEFGAVPEFFQNVVNNIKSYSSWSLEINNTPVYVIGQKELKEQITERIKEISKEGKIYTKEFVGLEEACGLDKRYSKEDCRFIGWLELDNNFLFFVDKDAFEKTKKLFEIK